MAAKMTKQIYISADLCIQISAINITCAAQAQLINISSQGRTTFNYGNVQRMGKTS